MNHCTCGHTFTDKEAAIKIHPHLADNTRSHINYLCPECGLWHKVEEVETAKIERSMTMSNTEISTKAKEYREIQQFIKQLEEEADALKAAIISEMETQKTDTIHTDIFTIKYTTVTSNRLDTKAIQSELPDIAARYTKTSEARRFQVA